MQIDPYLTELVGCFAACSCLIRFVFPLVVEEYALYGLLLACRRPVHSRVPILVRYAPPINHQSVEISRLLVDSGVERSKALVATVAVSGALDECLLVVVEQSPQLDRLVQPLLVKFCLGNRGHRDLLQCHLFKVLLKLARSLFDQILLPDLAFQLPVVCPTRVIKDWDGDTAPEHFPGHLALRAIHFKHF